MPNWCENDLEIEGKSERVNEFLKFAEGPESQFDFNRFIPYPEKFAELDQKAEEARDEWQKTPPEKRGPYPVITDGFNQGGYEWCCDHWGTKWNAAHFSAAVDISEW